MIFSQFQVVQRTRRSYHRHAHGDYEFHYICRGHCFFDREGKREKIAGGTFLYFSPHEEHHIIISDPDSPVTHYSYHLEPEEGDRDLLDLLENRIPQKTVRVGSGRRLLFEEVRSRIESGSRDQRTAGKYQLLSFLHQLPEQAKGARTPLRDDPVSGRIESLIDLMQKNIFESINLARLIGETGYSESYFIRRFKGATGLPPNRYFIRLKIDTARALLAESEDTIRTLAERLCFTDEFYFSRTFRKWTGMSPREFRKRVREG